jgi:lipid A 3-O-deacylase
MKKKNTVLRGFTLKIALATLPMGAAGAVLAGPLGIQVAAGVGDHHIKKLDLGLAWDPNWTWWPIGDWLSR